MTSELRIPAISALMTTYTESVDYVRGAVEPMLKQTLEIDEFVIVIDDPENDAVVKYLKEVAQTNSKVKVFINERNMGVVESLNRGLAEVSKSSEFVAVIDADDIASPERLEREYNFLTANNYDAVSCIANLIDEKRTIIRPMLASAEHSKVNKLLPIRNIMLHPGALIKTDVLRTLNGYRNFQTAQDYDLWLRMVSSGYRIGILNETLMNYRIRSASDSNANRFKTVLSDAYIQKLHRERIKNSGQDSFSFDNQTQYNANRRLDDITYANHVNSSFMKFNIAKENLIQAKSLWQKAIASLQLLSATVQSKWVLKLQLDTLRYTIAKRM